MAKRKRQRNVEPCEACGGRGWLLMYNSDREVFEIQRCDTCMKYDSDKEAGEQAAPIIDHALTYWNGVVVSIARTADGQYGRRERVR